MKGVYSYQIGRHSFKGLTTLYALARINYLVFPLTVLAMMRSCLGIITVCSLLSTQIEEDGCGDDHEEVGEHQQRAQPDFLEAYESVEHRVRGEGVEDEGEGEYDESEAEPSPRLSIARAHVVL